MEDYTPAEYYQLKLIYAAVFCALGFIDPDVLELQKSIQAGVRSISFPVAVAGHGGSGSVKYSDRYPPLSKCITAFKANISGMEMEDVLKFWRWIGRDSHDRLIRRYTRQFSSTVKICSYLGYAIKCQMAYNGEDILAKGDRYYFNKDPKYSEQFQIAKLMIIGLDNEKRPLILMRARTHFPKGEGKELLKRLDFLLAETIAAVTDNLEGSTIIHDVTGLTTKNRDVSTLRFGLTNFTRIFPGCLTNYIFHNAPNFYKMGFKMINAALDAPLKSRVKFTTATKELLEYADLDQLPRELGGTNNIETIGYIPPRPEDDILMKDTETRDKLKAERIKLQDKFTAGIAKWICGETFGDRFEILAEIKANWISLDPYIRSKTIWDRQGIIRIISPYHDYEGPPSPTVPSELVVDETVSNSLLTPPSLNEREDETKPAEKLKMPPSPEEQQHTMSQNHGRVLYHQEAVFNQLEILERQLIGTNYVDEGLFPVYYDPEPSYQVYEDQGQDPSSVKDREYPAKPTSISLPEANLNGHPAFPPQEIYQYANVPVNQYNTGYMYPEHHPQHPPQSQPQANSHYSHHLSNSGEFTHSVPVGVPSSSAPMSSMPLSDLSTSGVTSSIHLSRTSMAGLSVSTLPLTGASLHAQDHGLTTPLTAQTGTPYSYSVASHSQDNNAPHATEYIIPTPTSAHAVDICRAKGHHHHGSVSSVHQEQLHDETYKNRNYGNFNIYHPPSGQ